MKKSTILRYTNLLDRETDFELMTINEDFISIKHQSMNYYSILFITKGSGKIKLDFSDFKFSEKSILFFPASQDYSIESKRGLKGYKIFFNSKVLSIRNLQEKIPKVKLLYSSCYTPSILKLKNESEFDLFHSIIEYFKNELLSDNRNKQAILALNLKAFIKTSSYLKSVGDLEALSNYADNETPFKSQYIIDAIEHNFRSYHNAEFYANLFLIPFEELNQICIDNFKKPLVDLIFERIIIEANRLLYLTTKENKEITLELGFSSERKFTTFFKTRTGISPDLFRQILKNG